MWRFEALLWQAGGEILSPDGKQAAFDSPAGVQALTLLQQMAVQDHSVYLDSGNDLYANLFNSGHIGMLYTGPWDLAGFPNVNFGVQILPGDLNHQTISGPDNWVLFNNGSARTQAAWKFISWFTSSKQSLEWSQRTGDLPIRSSDLKLPGYAKYVANYPGVATFVKNLQNAAAGAAGDAALPEDLGGDRAGGAGGAARQGAAQAGARPGGLAGERDSGRSLRPPSRCGSCARITSPAGCWSRLRRSSCSSLA